MRRWIMRTLIPKVYLFPMGATFKIKFDSGRRNEGYFTVDVTATVCYPEQGVALPNVEVSNIFVQLNGPDFGYEDLHELNKFIQKKVKNEVWVNWMHYILTVFEGEVC